MPVQAVELDRERARARRDPLTGAMNRLALEEALRSEHARVVRGKRPTGVFFVDVDRFRDVNNQYGYAFGDTLLTAVYERLHLRLRPTDLVFRWGGEEFVILVPELGDERALIQFAERIRRLFPDLPLPPNPVAACVTVSVGRTLSTARSIPTKCSTTPAGSFGSPSRPGTRPSPTPCPRAIWASTPLAQPHTSRRTGHPF